MHVMNTEIHSGFVMHARSGIHNLASRRLLKIPGVLPNRIANRTDSLCRAYAKWEKEALKHYEDSPVYQQVVHESELGTLDVTLLQQQYDKETINTCLSKLCLESRPILTVIQALDHFGKKARRLKISRDGHISDSTFPACDPPKRYPNILIAHCGWPTYEANRVVQVNNGLVVHVPLGGPPVAMKTPQEEMEVGAWFKPLGPYFALGSTDFDWREVPPVFWDLEMGCLPESDWKADSSGEFEITSISVSPDAFTWTINPSIQTNKILVIDCKEQWEAVQQLYGGFIRHTDWKKMSNSYAGIDIRVGKHLMGEYFDALHT